MASKEVNDPITCPHCEQPLKRIDVVRDQTDPEPLWTVRIAGRMNATALKAIAKLMKGWAEG